MKTLFLICFYLIFAGCKMQPKISISNTLEIALGNKYTQYVSILNKASDKDTAALLDFFKINYVYDAAGYDHGYILYQLIENLHDEQVVGILKKMNKKDLDNISRYFQVGIDGNENAREKFIKNYPQSKGILLNM